MIINYVNHKSGINNLCVVFDKGCSATSVNGREQAIKNLKRQPKYKKIVAKG